LVKINFSLLIFPFNFFSPKPFENLDLFADINQSFQGNKWHDKPFIAKQGEKNADKNRDEK